MLLAVTGIFLFGRLVIKRDRQEAATITFNERISGRRRIPLWRTASFVFAANFSFHLFKLLLCTLGLALHTVADAIYNDPIPLYQTCSLDSCALIGEGNQIDIANGRGRDLVQYDIIITVVAKTMRSAYTGHSLYSGYFSPRTLWPE